MGYTAVQLSAVGAMNGEYAELDAAQAKQILNDNDLKCIATHRSWESTVRNDTDAEIAFHKTLGCDFTAIGGIPAPYKEEGADGYKPFLCRCRAGYRQIKSGWRAFWLSQSRLRVGARGLRGRPAAHPARFDY